MSAEWSRLAPSPEEESYLDEVQQGLTAGQTFCGRYYSCQNSEAWLLLAPAMLHDGDPGRGANCAVLCAIGRDKGNSGTQGQGRAEQAAEHGPIWRKGIGRDKQVSESARATCLFLRVRERCDGMRWDGTMAWHDARAIRRPHYARRASLLPLLHKSTFSSVCTSFTIITGNCAHPLLQQDAGVPDCRPPVSPCRVGQVASCYPHAFNLPISKREA